jgi:hypothetical protein
MPKYMKRPIVVEAICYDGSVESMIDVGEFIKDHNGGSAAFHPAEIVFNVIKSHTNVSCVPPLWIIAESDGDGVYPCTDAVFKETYFQTPVTEDDLSEAGWKEDTDASTS